MSLTLEKPPSAAMPEPIGLLLQKAKFNPQVTLFMVGLHALALLAFTQPFDWKYLPIMLGVYAWAGVGVTLYLHRTLTHRALKMHPALRFFFAMGTAVGLTGDPVGWVGVHRHHHRASDTDNDIHSPRHGFWLSHLHWFLKLPRGVDQQLRNLAKDVRQDPYCRWLEHTYLYLVPHALAAGLIYLTWGLPGLLWGLYVPIIFLAHVTYAINSVCHLPQVGYRRYQTVDDSRNVPWLGLLSFGESYHNNHHAKANRAQFGMCWYEIDTTAGLIWILEKLRLVRMVNWR